VSMAIVMSARAAFICDLVLRDNKSSE